MASELRILQPIARVVSVYYTMNLTYQNVMRSCYKPGKILSNARWEGTSPEGRRCIRKGFPREVRSDEKKKRLYYMLVVVIRP